MSYYDSNNAHSSLTSSDSRQMLSYDEEQHDSYNEYEAAFFRKCDEATTLQEEFLDEDSDTAPPAFYPADELNIRTPSTTLVCNALAYQVAEALGIKVLGKNFFLYDEKQGCYRKEEDIQSDITKALGDNADKLSNSQISYIQARILMLQQYFVEMDDFNSIPHLINTERGVFDWMKFTYEDHSKDYNFTYCVKAVAYLHDMDCIDTPTFDAFCATSLEGDEKKRQLLLEFIGYCLSDCTGAKCAFFLKGAPDSGKSVMLEFISKLLDPSVISSVSLHELHGKFNRALLFGMKINAAGEIVGKGLSEISTFKSITGGDKIQGEEKGEKAFFFTPRCKLVFAGNALPGTKESDATSAFANRLAVLLFNCSIEKDDQDKQLLDKLWNERNGIFTKAMYALQALHQHKYKFVKPDDTEAFLCAFKARQSSLHSFIEDCCTQVPVGKCYVFNTDLVAAYKSYCDQNGLVAFSKTKLYEMLSGITGITATRIQRDGRNLHGHTGIRLKEAQWNIGTSPDIPMV